MSAQCKDTQNFSCFFHTIWRDTYIYYVVRYASYDLLRLFDQICFILSLNFNLILKSVTNTSHLSVGTTFQIKKWPQLRWE